MNMSLPSRRHVGISPHEHQASGILEKYFLLEYSLPVEISFSPYGSNALSLLAVISFDVISLPPPFDIIFKEGFDP